MSPIALSSHLGFPEDHVQLCISIEHDGKPWHKWLTISKTADVSTLGHAVQHAVRSLHRLAAS